MMKPQPTFASSVLFALVLTGTSTLNQAAQHWSSPGSVSDLNLGSVADPGATGRSCSPDCKLAFHAAQQGPGRGAITPKRDPELEKQSLKSLDAARFYLFKRKPPKGDKAALERLNKAIEGRLLEIIDVDPTFSKMDEVYYLLGEVYARADQNDDAIKYLSQVVKEYPDSASFKDAKKRLDELQAKKEKK